MNDHLKKVKNPLFSVSVTGGTLEDFSQNAILLPAKEKPPPPTLNLSHEQILSDIIPNKNSSTFPSQQSLVDFGSTGQLNQHQSPLNFYDTLQQQPHPNTYDTIQQQYQQQHYQQQPSNVPPASCFYGPILQQQQHQQQHHQQQSSYSQPSSCFYGPILPEVSVQPSPSSGSQTLPELSDLQPHLNHNSQQQGTNFSSVFSSFSNILNIGNSNNSNKEVVVPPPAGIESLIAQGSTSSEPVPLIPVCSSAVPLPTPSSTAGKAEHSWTIVKIAKSRRKPRLGNTESRNVLFLQGSGPVNAFRRTGLKRPTYAPIPGFSSNGQPPTQNIPAQYQPPPPNIIPPLPVPTVDPQPAVPSYFLPQNASVSPANSVASSSSIEPFAHPLPNQFKPISPPPPSAHPLYPIPQPLPTVSTQPINFTRSSVTPKSFLSPVMDAIPDSEVMQSTSLNSNAQAVPNQINYASAGVVNPPINQIYKPVQYHWFYQRECEGKKIWEPFSVLDSFALEQAFTSNDLDPDKVIATDGGRYDVNILRRKRTPVYWNGNSTEVQRCSWFHRSSTDSKLVPYEENVATMLEEEYKSAFETNRWHKKIEMPNRESIVFHGPDALVLFPQTPSPDAWGNTQSQQRPRVIKRGIDDFHIDEGEPAEVDHILFMVHGIGSVCDLKLRTVEEVVDEFRIIAFQLVQSHYRSSTEEGKVHRVEVLPISWHDKLHSEETGIDKQLKSITLESIPKIRSFTNETLLDILFYTSPVYSEQIVSTVGNELNRVYDLFKRRNPSFAGGVSLGGHSLGSLILFDLLCHQDSKPEPEEGEEDEDTFLPKGVSKPPPFQRKISRRISYMMGNVGTGQPQITYPHLNFEPKAFFALGSPIGMFVIVRGLDTLGEKFSLPTCPAFFNIFHPYDPIAYRIEPLIHSDLGKLKPVLIPHHKGRKRMHLELKETMVRVGADLKQKVIDSVKSTWNSLNQLGIFYKADQKRLEAEVNEALREQLEEKVEPEEEPVPEQVNCPLGSLNQGRRLDYILQEAPFELINDYIFALTSHVCYWESEDTILLMLKEIYSAMGIKSDSQIPQQSMTIERPPPSPTSLRSTKLNAMFQKDAPVGMDPTAPIQSKSGLLPPPMTGFVRKT